MTAHWRPPQKLSERLRAALIPVKLSAHLRYRRAVRRHEPELGLVHALAGHGTVCIDAGANKGIYSYAMRRCGAEVHAFEPNPKAFAALERWARTAGVHALPIALSDRPGVAQLRVPKTQKGYSNQGASLSAETVPSAYGAIEVETTTIDDLGLKRVDFIKIDVEGHESAVIAGACRTLKRDRPNLLIEIEEKHAKRPVEATMKPLLDLGYAAFILDGGRLRPYPPADKPRKYVFNYIFLPTSAAGVAG